MGDGRWPDVWAHEGCGGWRLGRQEPSGDFEPEEWFGHCRSCHHYSAPGNRLGQCRHDPPALPSGGTEGGD